MSDAGAPPLLLVAMVGLVFSIVPVIFLVLIIRLQRDPENRPRVFLGPLPPPRSGVDTVRCNGCGREYETDLEACPNCARGIPKHGELDVSAWNVSRVWLLAAGTAVPYVLFTSLGALTVLPEDGFGLVKLVLWSITNLLFCVAGLVQLATFGAYIYIIAKSPIPDDTRWLWYFGFIFGGVLTPPAVFYYLVWEPRVRYRRVAEADRAERRGLAASDRRA